MYEEEVKELRKWRIEVTRALQRLGGCKYEDVPKLIRAKQAEVYIQNESIARLQRRLQETREKIKLSLKYLVDAMPRNGPVIRAISILEKASEDCFVCGGDGIIDVGDEMGSTQPCPNCRL
jgi:uncharacterized protein (DUF885 family)